MITIKDEIDLEIDWVIRETTRIKLLPHRYEFIEEEKDIYYKSMVPMIYAYLEGFVKNAIRIYMKFVNQLDLTFNDISIRLLVHKIEKKYNCFKENIKSIQNKEKLVEQLLQDINSNDKTINFNDKAIQNINSDRLNKLLRELNFKEIEDRKIYTLEDKKDEWKIREQDGIFYVTGRAVQRLMGRVNIEDNESMYYLQKCLKNMGIEAKLKEMGVI